VKRASEQQNQDFGNVRDMPKMQKFKNAFILEIVGVLTLYLHDLENKSFLRARHVGF
jgi:hypothetical protein